MPKPCSRPLTPNPFETYRDPVTGRWSVRYPTSAIPAIPEPAASESSALVKVEEDAVKRFPLAETMPVRRRWEDPARRTKVA